MTSKSLINNATKTAKNAVDAASDRMKPLIWLEPQVTV